MLRVILELPHVGASNQAPPAGRAGLVDRRHGPERGWAWGCYRTWSDLGPIHTSSLHTLSSVFSPAVDTLVLAPLTSVYPSPKLDQLDEVSGVTALFPKEPFPTCPAGKCERAATAAGTERAGPHLLGCILTRLGSRTRDMNPAETAGSLPCHLSADPDKASQAQWPGFLSGVPSIWEFLSLSLFPLFLFGKFDQVASDIAALRLKSKPELQLPEPLPRLHGDRLWPQSAMDRQQQFFHTWASHALLYPAWPSLASPRPCAPPSSTHTARWLWAS